MKDTRFLQRAHDTLPEVNVTGQERLLYQHIAKSFRLAGHGGKWQQVGVRYVATCHPSLHIPLFKHHIWTSWLFRPVWVIRFLCVNACLKGSPVHTGSIPGMPPTSIPLSPLLKMPLPVVSWSHHFRKTLRQWIQSALAFFLWEQGQKAYSL